MTEEEIIDIAKLENEIEAGLLSAILEEKGIVHVILSYHDTAYDGLFQVQKGWGVIRGPESVSDKVLEILEDIRSFKGLREDEEVPDEPA